MKAKLFQKGPKLGAVEVVLQKKAGLPTVATVSSLPWVKTTTRCLFVFALGRFWVSLAISAMSSVCRKKKKTSSVVPNAFASSKIRIKRTF